MPAFAIRSIVVFSIGKKADLDFLEKGLDVTVQPYVGIVYRYVLVWRLYSKILDSEKLEF